jgi:hypothetical protein
MTPPDEGFNGTSTLVRLQARCGGQPAKDNPVTAWEGTPTPDVLVANQGSVFIFNPLTERAQQWINENVQSEDWQWFGTSLVVDHRYAWGLAEGMQDAGLVLQ